MNPIPHTLPSVSLSSLPPSLLPLHISLTFIKARPRKKAIDEVKDIERLADRANTLGLPRTHEVLAVQIRTYLHSEMWDAAQAVFNSMRSLKIVPERELFTRMIVHAAKVDDVVKCEQYFEGNRKVSFLFFFFKPLFLFYFCL